MIHNIMFTLKMLLANARPSIKTLLDEIERLRDALRPFAEMAVEAGKYGDYKEAYLANAIRFEDCQRAEQFLKGKPE